MTTMTVSVVAATAAAMFYGDVFGVRVFVGVVDNGYLEDNFMVTVKKNIILIIIKKPLRKGVC